MEISVNMRIAVRGGIRERRQPRSKELCRGVLPQCGDSISLPGCQVSWRFAHSAIRSVACGSQRVVLGAQLISAHRSVFAKTGCKSPRVSGGAPVAYPINRNMGAFPVPCCLSNGEVGPRRLYSNDTAQEVLL